MSLARIQLKGQLLTTIGPLCDLCAKRRATDLHELLLERDDANGNPELLRLALESWQNCTVLCNPCNIGPAKLTLNRDLLIAKQIIRAGSPAFKASKLDGQPRNLLRILQGANILEAWLASLPMKDVRPYIRRVARVANALIQEETEHDRR
jgi:hypothetical protein